MGRPAADSARVITDALVKAGEALSALVERQFKAADVDISVHDPLDLPSLWAGGESTPVSAAFYQVQGDLSGYLLLVFPLDEGDMIARALLGLDAADRGMVDSALGEVGNIVGSAFLNHLSDHFKISAVPTPPQVIRDMMGALLATLAAASAAEGRSQVPLIRTTFTQHEGTVNAYLLWIADLAQIERLGGGRRV